ncbi:phosphatidylethanolamine N-methyltransferase-like [Mizuhopecten yessoensis]|uniref:Phosphatidylethanolamine N-methyltransferase n=1 Tax=Mizuhopecten yessoensis TaxID=6573 RepID=A0A210PXZ9_MIZYE|nr:phosphatidylethanolamine N-methyltransferase-like [Mizuhopecten yessoensis]OWF41357.1 Phosphatidyl-N-methylethanolamine N-methyltransferase [Mizuhopecten yessoensis]
MTLQTTRKPTGCCDDVVFVDVSKMEWPLHFFVLADFNLWITICFIIFNPLVWNVVARWEYRNGGIRKVLGGKKRGVILMAILILSLGVLRDWMFKLMLDSQPKWPRLYENRILWSGYASMWIGTTLVFSSFYSLGFYGTFLGDYFGILLDERVTSFPFNILDNPMYVGSTLNFLGAALVNASQTGILVSMFVAIAYRITLMYEGPFTEYIYSRRTKER